MHCLEVSKLQCCVLLLLQFYHWAIPKQDACQLSPDYEQGHERLTFQKIMGSIFLASFLTLLERIVSDFTKSQMYFSNRLNETSGNPIAFWDKIYLAWPEKEKMINMHVNLLLAEQQLCDEQDITAKSLWMSSLQLLRSC